MVYKTTTDTNQTHFLGGIWKEENVFSIISGIMMMMIRFWEGFEWSFGDTKEFVWSKSLQDGAVSSVVPSTYWFKSTFKYPVLATLELLNYQHLNEYNIDLYATVQVWGW